MERQIFKRICFEIDRILSVEHKTFDVKRESRLYNDIGLCSLDMLMLLTCIEIAFEISIEDIEADKLDTVNSLIKLIEYKIEQNATDENN